MPCKLLLMITKLLIDNADKEDLMTGDQDNAAGLYDPTARKEIRY